MSILATKSDVLEHLGALYSLKISYKNILILQNINKKH